MSWQTGKQVNLSPWFGVWFCVECACFEVNLVSGSDWYCTYVHVYVLGLTLLHSDIEGFGLSELFSRPPPPSPTSFFSLLLFEYKEQLLSKRVVFSAFFSFPISFVIYIDLYLWVFFVLVFKVTMLTLEHVLFYTGRL